MDLINLKKPKNNQTKIQNIPTYYTIESNWFVVDSRLVTVKKL